MHPGGGVTVKAVGGADSERRGGGRGSSVICEVWGSILATPLQPKASQDLLVINIHTWYYLLIYKMTEKPMLQSS